MFIIIILLQGVGGQTFFFSAFSILQVPCSFDMSKTHEFYTTWHMGVWGRGGVGRKWKSFGIKAAL